MRAIRRLRWVLEYGAGRAALFAANLLPERFGYAVAGALGRSYFRCAGRRRRYALRTLRYAYPSRADAELLQLARVATGNIFKVVLDTVRAGPAIRKGSIAARIDINNVTSGLPAGPFLAVTPHLGSWEMAGIACALLRGEAHAIARVFANPLLQRFILANRRRAGLIIHPKRGGIRGLAAALERGVIGMQVADQHQRLRGVRVPFFGHEASTERSAAVLSLRKGYPIVVGGAVRVGPGFRFKLVMMPVLRPEPTGDHEGDVRRVAAEVNRRLEHLILAYPEQYLWIHNRYRDPPPAGTDDHPAR